MLGLLKRRKEKKEKELEKMKSKIVEVLKPLFKKYYEEKRTLLNLKVAYLLLEKRIESLPPYLISSLYKEVLYLESLKEKDKKRFEEESYRISAKVISLFPIELLFKEELVSKIKTIKRL